MEKLEDKTTTDSLNTSTVSSSIDEIEASDFTEEEAKKAETFKAEEMNTSNVSKTFAIITK